MTPSVMVMLVVRSHILYSLLVECGCYNININSYSNLQSPNKGENIGDVTAKGGLGILQI